MINDRQTFCARLKKARQNAKLKQESVAQLLQVPVSAVSAMESGKRKVDALELFALSLIYHKPMEWFFSWHPEMTMTYDGKLNSGDALASECLELLRTMPADMQQVAILGLKGLVERQ